MRLLPAVVILASVASLCGCTQHQFRETEGERILREWRESLDRVPARRTGNVMIMVDRTLVDQSNSAGVSAAWRYTDENIAVGSKGGDLARRNGIRIGVVKDGFAAQFRAALEKVGNKETSQTFLTTLSGSTAAIMVGQDTYIEVLRYRTLLGESVVLQRAFVGTSLVIEPTILPDDRIRVELYPRLTTREGRSVNLTDLATEVVVNHGQPLVIGGLEQSSENSAGAALFSWGRQRRRRNLTMTVTPYIDGAR